MGLKYLDKWTYGHFMCGFFSRIIIFRNDRNKSFLFANGGHLFIEILEKNETPEGHKLESYKNHLTDCIAFLLGWLIMDFYFKKPIRNNILLRILKVIFGFILFSELTRELFPNCKGGVYDSSSTSVYKFLR